MSASVAARRTASAPVYGALAAVGAFILGTLFAIRPALGAAALGAAVFVPLVMISVPAAIAVWVSAVFVILGLATTGMQLLIAAAWLGSLVARPGLIRQVLPGQRLLVGALALLLAWLCLSSLWARDAEATWQELRWWLVAGGVLVVVATTIGRPGQLKLILLALVVGALLSVVIGWLHGSPAPVATTDVPVDHSSNRFAGLEGNPNDLAAQLLPATVFAAALLADCRRLLVRAALAAALTVLTVAFAATQSRGGLFAAGVVMIGAALLIKRQRHRVLLAIASIAAVAGAWFALSPGALSRVTSLNDGGAGRSTLWLVAWRMAKDFAPEGVGLNNFRILAPYNVRQPGSLRHVEQIDSSHVVHNTYLQLLAETGVIGLSLFLAVAGACLAAAHRAARAFERLGGLDLARLSHAALLAGLAVLAVQLFQSDGYDVRFWVILGLGPALLTIATHRQSPSGGGPR